MRRIIEAADRLVAARRAVGVALAFVEDGAVVGEQAVGRADRDIALTPRHVFQAASLAKLATAWLVLGLAERGRLELDAPLERYLTRWRLPASGFDHSGVTVRRVLSHTAGLSLPDYPGFEPGRKLPALEASLSGDTNGGGDLRVIEPPGARFRYSGGGFALLQLLVEERSGEPFAARAAGRLFRPLGMTRSSFDPGSPLADEAASGHDARGAALPFYRYDGAAAAGLMATAGDLARFAAAHMAGPNREPAGRGIVSPAAIEAMLTPQARTERADGLWPEYGLGAEIERGANGRTLAGHHGTNRGWRALLAMDLAARRAVVLLANCDAAGPALEALLADWRG